MSVAYRVEIFAFLILLLLFLVIAAWKKLNKKIHFRYYTMVLAAIMFGITSNLLYEMETDKEPDTDIADLCDCAADALTFIPAMAILVFIHNRDGVTSTLFREILLFLTPLFFGVYISMSLFLSGISIPYFQSFGDIFSVIGYYGLMLGLLLSALGVIYCSPDLSNGEPSTKLTTRLKLVSLIIAVSIVVSAIMDILYYSDKIAAAEWFDILSDILNIFVVITNYFFIQEFYKNENEKVAEPTKIVSAESPLLAQQ